MAVRLTKRTIDTATPSAKEAFIWDADLSGFGLRVSPAGRKTFVAQFRVGGGRHGQNRRVSIGTYPTLTADEARSRARDLLARAQLGEDPNEAKRSERKKRTVDDLIDLWLSDAAHINRRTGAVRNPKSIEGETGRINAHLRPLIGGLQLDALTRPDIERLRDQIASGATRRDERTKARGFARVRGGQGTAARTIRLFSSILAFAVDRKLIAENPALGVRLPPGRVMNRFLSPEELGRLGSALNNVNGGGASTTGATIIRLLALTGARRGEITNLKWEEVDLHRSMLRLVTSKTGAKVVPLAPPACLLLSEILPHEGSAFVFPASSGDGSYQGVGKVWAAVRKAAGLESVRLHDLRHTFASFGASGNFGLPVIGALLGHRQPATTQRYAHLADDPLRLAAARIGSNINAAMSEAPREATR